MTEFSIGQMFEGKYPPEAAAWCNRNGAYIERTENGYEIKAVPEPTPEEIAAQEVAQAQAEASVFMMSKFQKSFAQTSAFSSAEFAVMVKAKLFESWKAGETYSAGYRLEHKGIVYEVVQEVTAIENQPPDAVGMLAIYRPLSVDSETGTEPDGTKENPYTYLHGMDVKKDCYYTFDDKLWLAKADMPACVWNPGTAGLWQWEEVTA